MPSVPRSDDARMGLADEGVGALAERVAASWAGFLDVARTADLEAPSRLPGWRGQEVLVHLGAWDDDAVFGAIVESARHRAARTAAADAGTDDTDDTDGADTGRSDAGRGDGDRLHPDRVNADITAAHRTASRAEVLAALERHRDRVLDWLATDEPAALARVTADSVIGPLPLLTVVGASTYELAVHALDLAPCGAAEPDPELLLAGLGAVLDVTGCLAHRRALHLTVTATSPQGGWTIATDAAGWDTVPALPGRVVGTGVRGTLADLVDATAGRHSVPALLATRRIVAHDLPGFLRLATVIEDVPGLPGGPALRAAARTLGGAVGLADGAVGLVSGLARRLPGLGWRR